MVAGLSRGFRELGIKTSTFIISRRPNVVPTDFNLVGIERLRASPRTHTYIAMAKLTAKIHQIRPDLILIYDASWPVAFPSLLVAKMHQITALVICGELHHVAKPGLRALLERSVEYAILGRADAVLCLPGDGLSYLQRELRGAGVIVQIPNVCGASTESSLQDAQDESGRDVFNKRTVLAYAGSCTKLSGTNDLWEAVELLLARRSDFAILFLGDPNCIPPRLASSRIVYTPGWVPPEQVGRLLEQAHIGIVTAANDEANRFRDPIKTYEYMNAGLPVVGPNIGGTKTVITEANCGLLYEPGNAWDLSEQVERLLENPTMREDLGRHAALFASRSNQPRSVAATILQTYAMMPGRSGHVRTSSS